ncbi:RagB/SusD family nutrient uptake outer membrane protein [Compostibacter hankyongensis]|uniref:RagB/SusD family nutrient uptake outer membrane protein n=1 Tax=Compostibacter hankyongensis TaxID=1007089 RepID=A0ABP8FX68_9BACT
MKNVLVRLSLILSIAVLIGACNDLDIQPVDTLTGDQIFSSEVGINAALQSMYMQLHIDNFAVSDYTHLNIGSSSTVIGEAQLVPLRIGNAKRELLGGDYSWWNYTAIRYCNLGIQGLIQNYDKFESERDKYNHWLGEAYFCRAYMYYTMVRSFGGVPIVKTPESYLDYPNAKDMEIPRNTEKEVVDFIASDLDSAMMLMGPDELERGRANKYIAANLKARVMLFAACEAKNGQVQLNGLVGIPASESKEYYKKAYAAARFATENGGKYKLYRKYDDGTYMGKVKNYEQIFLDETADNTERMFVLPFDEGVNAHCWDANQRPKGYTEQNDPSGELSATLEWVELFDDVDGNPGKLKIGDPANPVRYSNTEDLFARSQPRLRATVLLPGVQFPGSSNPADRYEIRKGIYESYPGGPLHTASNNTDKWNGMTISGKCGIGDIYTTDNGFIVWKYQNPAGTGAYWTSFQDWIEMRYAEVLLNKAEAAINIIGETVDGTVVTMQDALGPINEIRERAGTSALTAVDEAKIINERRCELAFENQLVWDMKRWRMLEEVVQNKTFSSLYPYFVADENKYIFLRHSRNEIRYRFDSRSYYAPIPASAIQRNPNLLPNNPGY